MNPEVSGLVGSPQAATPRKGDWVQVYGQITAECGEDFMVEFFSHNQQWEGYVERRRVQYAHAPHDIANQCNAITEYEDDALIRCDGHHRHGGPHGHHLTGITWTDDSTVGYFEAAS